MRQTTRVHICQISTLPAYFDELGSYSEEFVFPPREKERLAQLRSNPQIGDLLHTHERDYQTFMTRKIEALIAFSASRGAEVVVFPEYAVPNSVALAISDKYSSITLVLGSHRVSPSMLTNLSSWDYRGNAETVSTGFAGSPIRTSGGQRLFIPKHHISKWEPTLREDSCSHADRGFLLSSLSQKAAVYICMDALYIPQDGLGDPPPQVVICPALSPEIEQFRDIAASLSSHEIDFIFCNHALYGGSFAYYHNDSRLLGGKDPQYPPPAGTECIIEVDLPLEDSLRVRGTVRTESARRHPRVFLCVPESLQAWKSDLNACLDLMTECLASEPANLEGARDALHELIIQYSGAIPDQLLARMKAVRHNLDNYEGSAEPLCEKLTFVHLPEDIGDFLGERARHGRDVLRSVEDELPTEHESSIDGVFRAIRRYIKKHPPPVNSRPAIDTTPETPPPRSRELAAQVMWFKGRGSLFDELESFFRADPASQPSLLITGLFGFGKTAALRILFPRSLARLSPVWVSVPHNASFSTVLARAGVEAGVTLDIDFLRTASRSVFQRESRRIIDRLLSNPSRPVIIDDLADMAQDGRNVHQYEYFLEEVQRARKKISAQIAFVCSRPHPFVEASRSRARIISVPPLTLRESDHALRWYVEHFGKTLGVGKPRFPDTLLRWTGGHPLGIRLLAQTMTQQEVHDVLHKEDLPERPAALVVGQLFPKVKFSGDEQQILETLSVLREPCAIDEVGMVLGSSPRATELSTLLRDCMKKGVVDFDGVRYSIHSLFRAKFYDGTSDRHRSQAHRRASVLYQERVHRTKQEGKIHLPQLAELAYHLMGAGDIEGLRRVSSGVASEAIPMARALYVRTKKSPHAALRAYELLAELMPENPNIRAYIGRCHGRLGDPLLCDKHFRAAIDLARKSGESIGWLFRDWGQMLGRAENWSGCLEKFERARVHGTDDASMIATEALAAWKSHQDIDVCLGLIERAVRASPTHTYVLATCSRVLSEAIASGNSGLQEKKSQIDIALSNAEHSVGRDWEDWRDDESDDEPRLVVFE